MKPLRTIPLRDGRFEIWSVIHCRTVYDDGTSVPASPDGSAEQSATARDLGYGDDVARMVIDHELAHSLLAEWRGLPRSPVMHDVAHGIGGRHEDEEALVLAFQKYLNTGEVRSALEPHAASLERWHRQWKAIVEENGT